MIARIEQIESEVGTAGVKKRWVAPNVTRLDFPKTAFSPFGSGSHDSLYSVGS